MEIKIKTKSKLEKIAVTTLLYSLGYSYGGVSIGEMLEEDTDLTRYYTDYPHVLFDSNDEFGVNFCNNDHVSDAEYTWTKDYQKIIDKIVNPYTMKLTDDYNATVTEDGIVVGCQTISFKKLDELVNFVKNRRK